VVAEAANWYEVLDLVSNHGCLVVVMDVAMPDLNGIETTRRLLKDHPHIKVIGLTGHGSLKYVTGMLQAGASGYLLKACGTDDLVRAVHIVMEGKTYLSPEVASSIVQTHVRSRTSVTPGSALAGLTLRERELLQLIAEGKTTKHIADVFQVSGKTIETHRRNLMNKLQLRSTALLTKCAVREGITSVDF
jgi:DNA-binding NarL/FixJ family response regulator